MCFEFTHIAPDMVRCCPRGPVTAEDSNKLRAFLKGYRGRLLVDLGHACAGDCAREFFRVRVMLPQTAFFGAPVPRLLTDGLLGKEFYMHEVRSFESEDEALLWLKSAAA